MKIQLVDINPVMCNFWKLHFSDCEDVEVFCGDFFTLPTDCVVSPANSFGFMNGGLDALITKKLGIKTQEKLQKKIQEEFNGELLVGQATLIETEFPEIPYCISAPTMRVPLLLTGSVNVYLAAKAVFILLLQNPQIQTVTISGLGTGVGKIPFDICAKHMRQAYNEIILKQISFPKHLSDAQKAHKYLITSGYKNEDIKPGYGPNLHYSD